MLFVPHAPPHNPEATQTLLDLLDQAINDGDGRRFANLIEGIQFAAGADFTDELLEWLIAEGVMS